MHGTTTLLLETYQKPWFIPEFDEETDSDDEDIPPAKLTARQDVLLQKYPPKDLEQVDSESSPTGESSHSSEIETSDSVDKEIFGATVERSGKRQRPGTYGRSATQKKQMLGKV